jgi:hypothetical protein
MWGCSESSDTQVVVVMDTDYGVPTEIDRIRMRVLKMSEDGSEEVETWRKDFLLADGDSATSGRYTLPASFGVVPDESDLDREIVIEAEGSVRDQPVVERRIKTGFVRGEFRVVRMFLYRQCSEASCPDGESCGCLRAGACASPSCVDEFVDPEDLDVTTDPGVLPSNAAIPEGCGSGLTRCGTECVDTDTDPRFCGGCTGACASGALCTAGQCVDPADCQTGGTSCEGFTYCDEMTGQCLRGCAVDEQCGSDETCDVGTHACVCTGGLLRCPPDIGDCVDTDTDLQYCGDCNTSCPSNNVCEQGLCVDLGDCRTNGIGCTGFSYCDENTGECLRGCLLDEQCGAANEVCDLESHDCVCDDGFERCPPTVGDCVDTQSDPTYCGDCNTSCAGGEICQEGLCFDPDCRTNGIPCEGFTYCDPDAGRCLPGCDRDAQCLIAGERCDTSTNTCVCNPDLTRCGLECVDTETDVRYCGTCTVACAMDELCEAGVCLNPDCRTNGIPCEGFTYCDPELGECLPGCDSDTQCLGVGESCNLESRTCECDSGLTLCDNACVNLSNDRRNCGSCGTRCRGNEICLLGQCFGFGD